MDERIKVTETAAPAEVAPEVTPSGSGVTPVTPAMPASDAPNVTQLLAERDAKWQNDLNRLKSSLQSQQAATDADYRRREAAYTARIRELEVAGLDETQRAKYDQNMLRQDFQALQEQYFNTQAQLENERLRQTYAQAFAAMGVPMTALDMTSPQTITQSGWEAVSRQMQELRAQAARAAPASSAAPTLAPGELQPPNVVIPGGNVPGAPTWDALIQRYGSMEKVYSLVEQGMLPPSILPV